MAFQEDRGDRDRAQAIAHEAHPADAPRRADALDRALGRVSQERHCRPPGAIARPISELHPSTPARHSTSTRAGLPGVSLTAWRQFGIKGSRSRPGLGAAVEPRSIRLKSSVCWSCTSACSMIASSSLTARSPISRIGCRMVVNGGVR
ncbi:hypothetical protein G6F62_014767 [Rhizopus arrhizus]|nr:hypothetical protein G6F62_014767 [Rhizopus arrhizus]